MSVVLWQLAARIAYYHRAGAEEDFGHESSRRSCAQVDMDVSSSRFSHCDLEPTNPIIGHKSSLSIFE
ncbi:hypothetical protein BD289DRAFT_420557 [Coniella lustricola]|uniref:Uncharacterized protein n=1 Tax=Coniella lustricola TaxID=2025994 RepID=A0A2T3AMK7_9PEZI|nr:hypothetical protein BD289DRAFT_420557 [Coniella lustricola]